MLCLINKFIKYKVFKLNLYILYYYNKYLIKLNIKLKSNTEYDQMINIMYINNI